MFRPQPILPMVFLQTGFCVLTSGWIADRRNKILLLPLSGHPHRLFSLPGSEARMRTPPDDFPQSYGNNNIALQPITDQNKMTEQKELAGFKETTDNITAGQQPHPQLSASQLIMRASVVAGLLAFSWRFQLGLSRDPFAFRTSLIFGPRPVNSSSAKLPQILMHATVTLKPQSRRPLLVSLPSLNF